MASFDNLPPNSIASYWSWNGSPNLPAVANAKCPQKMVHCDDATPLSVYTAPTLRAGSTGEAKLIITGIKYNTFITKDPSGGRAWLATAVGIGNFLRVGYAMDTTLGACRKLFTHGDGNWGADGRRVDRRDRKRAMNADAASSSATAGGVYPDIIMYNGTKYTDDRQNDLLYKDSAGNIFDLKLLGA
ncbi:hypothetical protein MMC14_009321 [Varicellaria rhodocarpa]|nr:hypothetical protein [Varicellaria rhodocarpa]